MLARKCTLAAILGFVDDRAGRFTGRVIDSALGPELSVGARKLERAFEIAG
jgi:hypothetical protein